MPNTSPRRWRSGPRCESQRLQSSFVHSRPCSASSQWRVSSDRVQLSKAFSLFCGQRRGEPLQGLENGREGLHLVIAGGRIPLGHSNRKDKRFSHAWIQVRSIFVQLTWEERRFSK